MPIVTVLRENLNEEQYLAATDTAKEVHCLACAGSGKSRTLAYRIARLIAEGNTPESIVAFTFTEKAAESIKRRVADALEKSGLSVAMVGAMYIGTIHSYCKALLGEIDARYRLYEVLDDNGLRLFLLSRYAGLGLHRVRGARQQTRTTGQTGQFETIKEVANAWKITNDEMVDYATVTQNNAALGQTLQLIYDQLMQAQFLDFSLLIRLVVDEIRANSPAINRALQNVRHLMVDEYQDVNPSQEELIRGINNRTQTLFVVGDDDQAIYGWRGADVRNIIEFDRRYANCSSHTLSTNFRSTQAIVETSNDFIRVELATNRMPKTPAFNRNGNIRHFGNLWFDSRQEEAEWIARRINELVGTEFWEDEHGAERRGLTKSDIAILIRSVKGGTMSGNPAYHREFTTALENADIRYTIEAEGSIFERPHSRVVRDAMELLRDPGAINRNQAQEFLRLVVIPHFPNADSDAFLNVLYEWNREIHVPAGGARRKVYPQKLVHDLLSAFRVQQTQFDDTIMRDLGVFSSIVLDIEKVYISIDRTERYREILNFLGNAADSYDSTSVELLARPDAVTVSTVHKMKGLEFPVVFLVDTVNDRFPLKRRAYSGWLPQQIMQPVIARGLYETNHQAEARLFYTAITRAERFLYVTGSAAQPGLVRPKRPSNFKNRLAHPEITNDVNSLPQGMAKLPERRRVDDNSMPTSFTEVKDYLDCPMKYKFRKLYGFSPAVPELFGFGQTAHTAINKLHQDFTDRPPTREEAEQTLEDVFHLKHVFPSQTPGGRGPFENARDKAKNILGNYVEDYGNDFTLNRRMEYRFEIKAGRALITGSIDLLLRLDATENIVEATVIDFKTMDREGAELPDFWINKAMQVQLYAHAATVVLGENAKTGAVHLLKERNTNEVPNRVIVPVTDEAVTAAVENVKWAVEKILQGEFPKRPSHTKCAECDFNLICSKMPENFNENTLPPEVYIPETNGVTRIMVGAFSDFDPMMLR